MSAIVSPLPPISVALPPDWEKLFTAVLSDALDAVGITTQAMSPGIRPLDDQLKLCGRARTGVYMETAYIAEGSNPYELEIALVDDLRPGDVAVLACGGSSRIAPWGGLLSTATHVRGAAGCITDGFVRDILEIRALQLPVFHGGIAPLDSKGRGQIQAIDVPVICGGVRRDVPTRDFRLAPIDPERGIRPGERWARALHETKGGDELTPSTPASGPKADTRKSDRVPC